MYLSVLAQMGNLLNLKDVKTSSYLMAISDLVEEIDTLKMEEKELEKKIQKQNLSAKELMEELQQIQNVEKNLEEAVEEREKHGNVTLC
jgi:Tfp pilus assembly protein PilO